MNRVTPIGVGSANGVAKLVVGGHYVDGPVDGDVIAVFLEVPRVSEFIRFYQAERPVGVLLPPIGPYSHLAWAVTYYDVVAGWVEEPSSWEGVVGLELDADVKRIQGDVDIGVALLAQIQTPADVRRAALGGAQGAGEVRAEFVDDLGATYTDRLAQIVDAIVDEGWPRVPLRVWDASPDKPLMAGTDLQHVSELGYRGVRALLRQPELLRQFLTAVEPCLDRNVPMVLVLPMVCHAKEIEGLVPLLPDGVALGVTVETPAAVWQLSDLLSAGPVTFVEIGLNDLTQFTTAWTRALPHPHLAPVDRFAPGVRIAIEKVVEGCAAAGVDVTLPLDLRPSVELASEVLSTGISSVTVSPRLISHWRDCFIRATDP